VVTEDLKEKVSELLVVLSVHAVVTVDDFNCVISSGERNFVEEHAFPVIRAYIVIFRISLADDVAIHILNPKVVARDLVRQSSSLFLVFVLGP
jgi:hypothetical protein